MSKGRKPIDITDYTGKRESEATAGLEKAGFKVEIDRDYSDDVDKGRVISQSPNDGKGFKDDTITLEVSRGPEAIDVPNVAGQAAERGDQDPPGRRLQGASLRPGQLHRAGPDTELGQEGEDRQHRHPRRVLTPR